MELLVLTAVAEMREGPESEERQGNELAWATPQLLLQLFLTDHPSVVLRS